jgi:hypothetical protein
MERSPFIGIYTKTEGYYNGLPEITQEDIDILQH